MRGHLHFVVQPVTRAERTRLGALGPRLQSPLFQKNVVPAREEVEQVAERASALFRAGVDGRSWARREAGRSKLGGWEPDKESGPTGAGPAGVH